MWASGAGAVPCGAIGTARCAAVALTMRRHRHARQRAVPGVGWNLDQRHRPRRSERDARRRGRDASEAVPVLPTDIRPARARRSELATQRGRRDASEPCRIGALRGHRHGAMRSGSVDDAEASSRPPASRAGGMRHVDRRHRSRRSERDARRRGRDASEAVLARLARARPSGQSLAARRGVSGISCAGGRLNITPPWP